MSKQIAPIVLFVYNRPWHTKQTLESLSLNVLADESVLYIYADGPKLNASVEDLGKIKETRQVIKEKKWCKEVHIIESGINKGLANSIIQGVTEIVNKHEKIIVLEDDILTSKGFLKYMNEALELYINEDKVFGVSGYTYPVDVQLSDTFFLHMGCSWGWATWERAWQHFQKDSGLLLQEVNKIGNLNKFDVGGYPFYNMLQEQHKGKINSWAIRFYASLFLNKAYFLFPGHSLCKNTGFDNSGTHCGEDNFFGDVQVNQLNIIQKKIKVKEDKYARKAVEKSFSAQFLQPKVRSRKKTLFARIKKAIRQVLN